MPLTLAYEDLGSGPPVVILHGLFGSRRNWLTLAKQLSGSARVIVADLRNHGDSPHEPTMFWGEMAEDVRHMLDRIGLERAVIAGHSMGGKVAMTFANRFPVRTVALLVLDIAPVTYPNRFGELIAALRRLPISELKSRQQADAALAETIQDRPLRQFLLHNLVRAGHGFRWRMNLAVLEQEMNEISGFPEVTAPSAYTGPACFLAGDRSSYMEPSHLETIRALYPQTEIHTIAGAGHWVHADQPAAVLAYLKKFLGADSATR
ncbi:MAG: alpha/beta fold hydrolase [Gammaproteobacteria bacterium]|nr:alpha/beta fold hydrolase [Gammaproteobacteria bacterium]